MRYHRCDLSANLVSQTTPLIRASLHNASVGHWHRHAPVSQSVGNSSRQSFIIKTSEASIHSNPSVQAKVCLVIVLRHVLCSTVECLTLLAITLLKHAGILTYNGIDRRSIKRGASPSRHPPRFLYEHPLWDHTVNHGSHCHFCQSHVHLWYHNSSSWHHRIGSINPIPALLEIWSITPPLDGSGCHMFHHRCISLLRTVEIACS